MNEVAADYLPQLNAAVEELIARASFHNVVDGLKKQLQQTSEPFVWSTIDPEAIAMQLPDTIKSCWIFVLKKDEPSGFHYHPNSIQHMVMIEGEGTSRAGTRARQMRRLSEPDASLADVWYVIPEGVPHEFFPSGADVVVVSFHTCASDELKEISCDSGATRNYESSNLATSNLDLGRVIK
jgi:mannose-6-phosphate isomerase-like protein (cupin superfamily)